MTTLPNTGIQWRIQWSIFHDINFHIFGCYILIIKTIINNNKTLFGQPIDINKLLAVYIKKHEKWQSFAVDAQVPISQETMIYTCTKHAIATGLFNQAYKVWKHHRTSNNPMIEQTNNQTMKWSQCWWNTLLLECHTLWMTKLLGDLEVFQTIEGSQQSNDIKQSNGQNHITRVKSSAKSNNEDCFCFYSTMPKMAISDA